MELTSGVVVACPRAVRNLPAPAHVDTPRTTSGAGGGIDVGLDIAPGRRADGALSQVGLSLQIVDAVRTYDPEVCRGRPDDATS